MIGDEGRKENEGVSNWRWLGKEERQGNIKQDKEMVTEHDYQKRKQEEKVNQDKQVKTEHD